MTRQILERDWKLMQQLKPALLDRLCQRALTEVAQVSARPDQSWHQRYLAVYKLMHDQDRQVANAFNDWSRSTALIRLTVIRSLELLTPEEFARFSPETQELMKLLGE
jgi:hypothetical protein